MFGSAVLPGRRTAAPKPASGDIVLRIAMQTPQAALASMQSTLDGLSNAEAVERLQKYGPNVVARGARKGAVLHFLSLLASPLSLLLFALAVVNYFTGQGWSAVVIAVMVVLSSLLSFVQEHRSDRAAERLRAMVATTVTVSRKDTPRPGGRRARSQPALPLPLPAQGAGKLALPLADIVPGDIVFLSVGDIVPADVRILSCKDLFLSQASLTGESMPVERSAAAVPAQPASVLDLGNIAFMGTNVASGTACALVVATGGQTAFGHIAADLASERELTSFDRGVNKFIWLMLRVMLVMVPLVFLVNGLTKGDWLEALLFAVAVAVGLAPEMLPMIITINLATGALAMARKRVIVKRLNAIQNLGAMDILCTDKTGTLTQDKVILEKHVDIFGTDSEKVTEYAYLNSYHQIGRAHV